MIGRLLLLLLIPLAVCAGAFASGVDDYVFADGYWFKGGVAYTRTAETYQEPYTYYYQSGCCTYSATAYREKTRYSYAKANLPDYKDPGWRGKLLDIAAARDKVEGQMRLSAQEQMQFNEAVGALGLTGNFTWQGYGRNPVIGYSDGLLQLSSAGVQGNTVYGYSYSSVADVYGSTDLNALYQQAARLTQNAQGLAGEASKEFSGLVGQEGSNRARVAEILAKGQAAAHALGAAQAAPSARFESRSALVGPPAPTPAAGVTGGGSADFLAQPYVQQCVACHSAAKAGGGFDLTRYDPASADPATKAKLLFRLTTADPKLRMPRGGAALTSEQILSFFRPAGPARMDAAKE